MAWDVGRREGLQPNACGRWDKTETNKDKQSESYLGRQSESLEPTGRS